MTRLRKTSTLPLLACAFVMSGCGGIIPEGRAPTTGAMSVAAGSLSASPRGMSTAANSGRNLPPPIMRPSARIDSAPQFAPLRPAEQSCVSELAAAGAQFKPLPDSYGAPGCHKLGTVELTSLSGDNGRFGVTNVNALQCNVAKAFNDWVRFGVDRAARQILGSGLERVETMGTYSCRNVAGTDRRSAHARAEAIDVSGFVLKDGRRIILKQDWDGGTAAEREFLRVVQKSACKRFGTVLGPEYDAAHRDHFHMEPGGRKFCR